MVINYLVPSVTSGYLLRIRFSCVIKYFIFFWYLAVPVVVIHKKRETRGEMRLSAPGKNRAHELNLSLKRLPTEL